MFNINKTKTLSKQELWEKVEEFEIDALAGCLSDYLSNGTSKNFFETWHNLKENVALQIETWRECLVDNFFKDNPEINDLLVEVKEANVSGKVYPEKIWIASRAKPIVPIQ